MNMKNKLFAIGVACGLSFNLGAEAPSQTNVFFGGQDTLVIEEAAPVAGELMCTGNPDHESTECWAQYRAVLVARFQRTHGHGIRT